MKKKSFFVILVFVLVLVFTYNYLYKDARNINKEEPVFSTTSLKLYSLFKENNKLFNNDYLDKTLQINGIVTGVEQQGLVLDKVVYVTFIEATTMFDAEAGAQITIKGRYVGYDDLLEQLKIDQAAIINK